jgi:hypothetical protein
MSNKGTKRSRGSSADTAEKSAAFAVPRPRRRRRRKKAATAGVVYRAPEEVPEYRCDGCGQKTTFSPCQICLAMQTARQNKKKLPWWADPRES